MIWAKVMEFFGERQSAFVRRMFSSGKIGVDPHLYREYKVGWCFFPGKHVSKKMRLVKQNRIGDG